MKEVYSEAKLKFDEIIDNFKSRLRKINTGRASPSILEEVQVNCYGSICNLKNIAQITTDGATSLMVTPYDPQIITNIEKAINSANLGLKVSVLSSSLVNVKLPMLTEARRLEIVKKLKTETEQAIINLRNTRRLFKEQFKISKKEKALSEDEISLCEKSLQKAMDEAVKYLISLENSKEQEIISIK